MSGGPRLGWSIGCGPDSRRELRDLLPAEQHRADDPHRVRRRRRLGVPTAGAKSWWPVWRRSIRKSCPWCVRSFGASTSRSVTAPGVGDPCKDRHQLQTSDARGAASVQLGPRAVALVVRLHTRLEHRWRKSRTCCVRSSASPSRRAASSTWFHRAARQATPAYSALCSQVPNSPVVTPDETAWRVGAVPHWLWAFATPKTTVYSIRPGRGFDDDATVLGPDFDGVLVRDGWAPYRRCTSALHQTYLAHYADIRIMLISTQTPAPQAASAPRSSA